MNTIEIKDFDYDLGNSFAWIVINGSNLTVQCCLESRADENGGKKSIDASDCGHDWGICGDVNDEAFKAYGEKECMQALLSAAAREGIKVFNRKDLYQSIQSK